MKCKHWSDCGIIGGGCCAIGAFQEPALSVCNRCALRIDDADTAEARPKGPPPVVVQISAAAPVAQQIPLAGDLVASLTRAVGADRLAKWFSERTGKDCGCKGRQAWLNRVDAEAREWLKTVVG